MKYLKIFGRRNNYFKRASKRELRLYR